MNVEVKSLSFSFSGPLGEERLSSVHVNGEEFVPADEVDARIEAAVAARDAEWRRGMCSLGITEFGADALGPKAPEEARTYVEEAAKFAADLERERCARIAENILGGNSRFKVAAALRAADTAPETPEGR